MDTSDLYAKGLATRRRVLGEGDADLEAASAGDVTKPLQDLATAFVWGAIWSRPGLEPRVRSLVNLGLMTAMNRPRELAAHMRGALNNGCTREEIVEVLLQTSVYCGVPAAIEAFRVAKEVLDGGDGQEAPSR